jgi:hypothetical protein
MERETRRRKEIKGMRRREGERSATALPRWEDVIQSAVRLRGGGRGGVGGGKFNVLKGVRSKRRRRRRNHHSVDLMERERREKERLGPAEIKGMRRREAERGSPTGCRRRNPIRRAARRRKRRSQSCTTNEYRSESQVTQQIFSASRFQGAQWPRTGRFVTVLRPTVCSRKLDQHSP